jgi:cystathionine gamma-lyase
MVTPDAEGGRPVHDETRVVSAGVPAPGQGDPFLPGPVFAATYHLTGEPSSAPFAAYGRNYNPTWRRFELALAELEGGPAVVFGSGMAAVSAVLGSVLRPGDVVVMPTDGYYAARTLATEYLASIGVEVRLAPTAEVGEGRLLDGARLVCVETPGNPGLDVCDIAAVAAAAHRRGALVAVDNTTATALLQKPLALGADFSVASDTKALSGHSDLLAGHVAVRDPVLAEKLVAWRTRMGSVPGPMEIWLAHRSLPTLGVRLQRMCANGQAIAEFLSRRPEVLRTRYPGLPADPSHAVASRQMEAFGPIVSFELAGRSAAEEFLSACRLVYQATSFGGVHTTAERRARWGGDQVPDGFIRLSAGCEHGEDLLADLAQALDRTGGPRR